MQRMEEFNFGSFNDEIVGACADIANALTAGGDEKDMLLKVLRSKKLIIQTCTNFEEALKSSYTEALVTEVKGSITKADTALKRSEKRKRTTVAETIGPDLRDVFNLVKDVFFVILEKKQLIIGGYESFVNHYQIGKGSVLREMFPDDVNGEVNIGDVTQKLSTARPQHDGKRAHLTSADFVFLVFLYLRNRFREYDKKGM
jgi:hypothetical protein